MRRSTSAVVFASAALAVAFCLCGGIGIAFSADTIFRCGGENVSVGDSKYSVQKICGKPSRSESAGTTGKSKKQKEPKETTSKSSSGKSQKWYYDRGYGDYVYVLTFEKDVLKKIETSSRGR
jgi:hypothetical protein